MSLMHDLLGCEWGTSIATEDDQEPCKNQAEFLVVLHDKDREFLYKLCPQHRDRVEQETDPHVSEKKED